MIGSAVVGVLATGLLILGLSAGFGAVNLIGTGGHNPPPAPTIHAGGVTYRTFGPAGTIWENGTVQSIGSPVRVVFSIGSLAHTVIASLSGSGYSASFSTSFTPYYPTQVNATVWGFGLYGHSYWVRQSTPTVTIVAVSSGGTNSSGSGGPPGVLVGPTQVFAAFNWNVVGLSLTVFDQSTVYNGSITKIQWSFGDGRTAIGTNATHAYLVAGSYNVSELVIASNGAAVSAVNQTLSVATGISSAGCPGGPCTSPVLFSFNSLIGALLIGPASTLAAYLVPPVRSSGLLSAGVLAGATAASFLAIRLVTGT